MSKRCRYLSQLDAWARQGAGAELPAELREHALGCPRCREYLDEVRETRRAFDHLPEVELDPERVDSIRFAVMAEARRGQATGHASRASRRWLLGWSLAAAALAVVAAVGAVGFLHTDEPGAAPVTFAVNVDGASVVDLGSGETWEREKVAHAAPPPEPAPEPVAASEPKRRKLAGAGAGPAAAQAAQHDAEQASAVHHRDAAFRRAWRLLQNGRSRQAAAAFDASLGAPDLDPGRRADLLYWSARAHQLSGDVSVAQSRAKSLVTRSPSAWHAPHAALLMGESLLEQGDRAGARQWLERALESDREAVRARARELLGRR